MQIVRDETSNQKTRAMDHSLIAKKTSATQQPAMKAYIQLHNSTFHINFFVMIYNNKYMHSKYLFCANVLLVIEQNCNYDTKGSMAFA